MPPKGTKHRPESIELLREIARRRPPKPIPPEKRCSKCRQIKPTAEFYIRRDRGKRARPKECCKKCCYITTHAWAVKNREKVRSYSHKWNTGKGRDWWRNKHYQLRYGISLAAYDALLAAQGGACACCGKPILMRRHIHVDHCHRTHVVRGILCRSCNLGMGNFRDDPAVMERAIAYLRRTQRGTA